MKVNFQQLWMGGHTLTERPGFLYCRGVPQRQSHCRWGMSTLPSVGAVP